MARLMERRPPDTTGVSMTDPEEIYSPDPFAGPRGYEEGEKEALGSRGITAQRIRFYMLSYVCCS